MGNLGKVWENKIFGTRESDSKDVSGAQRAALGVACNLFTSVLVDFLRA